MQIGSLRYLSICIFQVPQREHSHIFKHLLILILKFTKVITWLRQSSPTHLLILDVLCSFLILHPLGKSYQRHPSHDFSSYFRRERNENFRGLRRSRPFLRFQACQVARYVTSPTTAHPYSRLTFQHLHHRIALDCDLSYLYYLLKAHIAVPSSITTTSASHRLQRCEMHHLLSLALQRSISRLCSLC